MRFQFGVLILVLVSTLSASATTWNEPWHDEVVRLADIFVKVHITEASDSRSTAKVLKLLGGVESSSSITIKGFSKLQLGSMSATDELSLPFKVGNEYYLLVQRDAKSNSYRLATPTSGWAWVENGAVYATYRHSYHRALVPSDVYEMTMQGIFNAAKGKPIDVGVAAFVNEQLSYPPAKLSDDRAKPETKRFFLQHVALETIFHNGAEANLHSLVPFIESNDAQTQISAARAVGRIKSAEARERLMKFIEGSGVGFAKVMCVWALRDQDARQVLARLQAFERNGKDEKTGFGGSIMDPRIGTYFPESVKAAIKELVTEWKRRQK